MNSSTQSYSPYARPISIGSQGSASPQRMLTGQAVCGRSSSGSGPPEYEMKSKNTSTAPGCANTIVLEHSFICNAWFLFSDNHWTRDQELKVTNAVALGIASERGVSHRKPRLQDVVHQLFCDCFLVAVALLEHALNALHTHCMLFRRSKRLYGVSCKAARCELRHRRI